MVHLGVLLAVLLLVLVTGVLRMHESFGWLRLALLLSCKLLRVPHVLLAVLLLLVLLVLLDRHVVWHVLPVRVTHVLLQFVCMHLLLQSVQWLGLRGWEVRQAWGEGLGRSAQTHAMCEGVSGGGSGHGQAGQRRHEVWR